MRRVPGMSHAPLTIRSITARAIVLKLKRPVVARIATLSEWPVILVDLFDAARKSLHFVGYEGLSMIAASGLDMAAWDALAKAANQPLCVLLGGTVGPVKSYNSNGLWLKPPEAVATEAIELREEGGF